MRDGEARLGARFRVDDAVAVIVGGASGIGLETAATLASAGARCVIADIDEPAAVERARELGADGLRISARAVDASDGAALGRMIDAVAADEGRIDILVNSAAKAARQPSEELPEEVWRGVVDLNLSGTFYACQAAGRHMLARGSGAIVNIASIMGLGGGGLYPNAAYHATKGGVINLTRALAVEWARRGVRVNAVAPTFVRTPLTTKLMADAEMVARIEQRTPMGRVGTVEEVAGAILFLCSPAAALITGHTLSIDGGWTAC